MADDYDKPRRYGAGMETMMAPSLSVVMPVYNGGRFLANAIESVLSQTYKDFEFIIIDDGSTDESRSVVERYARRDRRIRLISRENRGLAASLNEGVAGARGELIARMDADDISFPDRFMKQIAFLSAHPEVDLVGCRALAFKDSGAIGLLPFAPDHATLCARPWSNIPLPHPTWMGRRDWFNANKYRLPEVLRAEDQELLLRASATSRYACIEDVLLGYRQGAFRLRRTLVARRSLLAAQLRIFSKRRQWKEAFMASLLFIIKISIDIPAALPGGEALFFKRMGEPAHAAAIEELRRMTRLKKDDA